MNGERLPQKMLECCPLGIRNGRPRNLFMKEIIIGMRENRDE